MNNPSPGFKFVEDLARELSTSNLVFPTSLDITLRIRSAINDPNATVDRVARIVSAEPVLTAQLLKLSNVAALNPGAKKIADVKTAITRLGYNTVRSAAFAVGMRQMTQARTAPLIQAMLDDLWTHSQFVASMACVLARRLTNVNPDTAMLCGLLHDIGLFYILSRADGYPELFTDEQALMAIGFEWHTSIGHAILEAWDMSEEIMQAVDQHEDIYLERASPANLTDVIMMADCLSGQVKPDHPAEVRVEELPVFGHLGLTRESCEEMIRESAEERQAIMEALGS